MPNINGEIPNPFMANVVNSNTLSASTFNAGTAYVDIFGSMGVYERQILVGQTTETLADPGIWTLTQTNGATVTDGGQVYVLSSGSNAAGAASVQSVQMARFVPGIINLWSAGFDFPAFALPPNNSLFQFGPYTTQDGIALSWLNGALQIVLRKGGVQTTIPQSSFNGNPLLLSDYIFGATWSILYGVGAALIYVGTKLIHTVFSAAGFTSRLNFPLRAEISNTGNTTPFSANIVGWAIQSLSSQTMGAAVPFFIDAAGTTVLKHGQGTIRSIIVGDTAQAGVLTLYDNIVATGTPIFRTRWQANSGPQAIPWTRDFQTGLTAVTTNTNAINIDVT